METLQLNQYTCVEIQESDTAFINGGGPKSSAAGDFLGNMAGTFFGMATACVEKINQIVVESLIFESVKGLLK